MNVDRRLFLGTLAATVGQLIVPTPIWSRSTRRVFDMNPGGGGRPMITYTFVSLGAGGKIVVVHRDLREEDLAMVDIPPEYMDSRLYLIPSYDRILGNPFDLEWKEFRIAERMCDER